MPPVTAISPCPSPARVLASSSSRSGGDSSTTSRTSPTGSPTEGFVALAPDFYHGASTDEPDEAQRLLMGMAMDKAAQDIGGSARYLVGRE